ncbi:hypothetical protein [Synechococcus sp. PCC 7336]|uniref:hypothetical protein n=1 Tax=Synechococcus sp. PCC 7336 TaxID=195250 RepID=UPI000349DC54|nr:hypothetical protein [Synechococcus sp. PCC 7336]
MLKFERVLGFGAAALLAAVGSAAYPQVEVSEVSQVSEPEGIAAIAQNTDRYTPKISILSPQADATYPSTSVPLEIRVQRFPLGLDADLGIGMHLKAIVDNREPIDIYDLSEPLLLDLGPGTHTIRVVAASPWNASYRTLASFQHITFHVEEADSQNSPLFQQGTALLTLVSPSGSYGAEPILLDYLVDGVNLGAARVRYTLNGVSTVTTDRQPVYLEGWQPGENKLVVELVKWDDHTVFDNNGTGYNRVERTIIYNPDGSDTLSQLVRGELAPIDVKSILGPDPIVYDENGNPQLLR